MPGYSPALALLTGGLEVAAGLYALSGPGRKTILRPVAAILFPLAAYQFAEVAVCAMPAAGLWPRLAYLVITWLPPAGLWLAVALDEKREKVLRGACLLYALASAGLCLWIIAKPGVITTSVCSLVLARYFPKRGFDVVYALYYQTALLVIVFGSGIAMARGRDEVLRKHLANLQLGVLGFMAPAIAVRLLTRGPGDLLPSAMCHFALVLAASLIGLVRRERKRAETKAFEA
jgi:hypothetical protein